MKKARDIMTENPVCCTPGTTLEEAARLMLHHDVGEIPVVEDDSERSLVGVITDRDITCRVVALGRNPLEMKVVDCMSAPAISVFPDSTLEWASEVMQANQIRRVPVAERNGRCVGIISLADIAREESPRMSGEIVREVTRPEGPSLVS